MSGEDKKIIQYLLCYMGYKKTAITSCMSNPMIEYKVITLPLAEEDIADQTDYIAFELKSPETVINMVRGFKKVINSLSLFSQSHELDEDEELASYGIRKTYYKNYKIYFLIDEREQTVYILRVFHMLVDSKEKILKFFRS